MGRSTMDDGRQVPFQPIVDRRPRVGAASEEVPRIHGGVALGCEQVPPSDLSVASGENDGELALLDRSRDRLSSLTHPRGSGTTTG